MCSKILNFKYPFLFKSYIKFKKIEIFVKLININPKLQFCNHLLSAISLRSFRCLLRKHAFQLPQKNPFIATSALPLSTRSARYCIIFSSFAHQTLCVSTSSYSVMIIIIIIFCAPVNTYIVQNQQDFSQAKITHATCKISDSSLYSVSFARVTRNAIS